MSEPLRSIYSSAEEAWQALLRNVPGIDEPDHGVARCIFIAGMSSALAIAFHHGFAELRSELDREQQAMVGVAG